MWKERDNILLEHIHFLKTNSKGRKLLSLEGSLNAGRTIIILKKVD
jgi:hypothetical protein